MAEPAAAGLRGALGRLLRIPPPPEAPAGSPGSVRRFRAAPGFYRYRLVQWALTQIGAAWGLFVGFTAIGFIPPEVPFAGLARYAELVAAGGFLLQLPVTFLLVRMDFENRWYLVTDRSLRIREGLVRVREQTMSFANVQNLAIRQGPVQRLFGIADLRVRTAGGGGSAESGKSKHGEQHDLHLGYFRGVGDAAGIRDLILLRLRRLRDAGLGDPDEEAGAEPAPLPAQLPAELRARSPGEAAPPAAIPDEPLAAAREVLAEVLALRRALRIRGA